MEKENSKKKIIIGAIIVVSIVVLVIVIGIIGNKNTNENLESQNTTIEVNQVEEYTPETNFNTVQGPEGETQIGIPEPNGETQVGVE